MRKGLFLVGVCVVVGFLVSFQASNAGIKERKDDSFLVIAHRGASAYMPEHTLASYQLAKQMGADYIEIDVHLSKDGHLVAIHDEKVDRTTIGTGPVSGYTLEELKQLDTDLNIQSNNQSQYKENVNIPTLKEILYYFGPETNYYIELKSPHLYPEAADKLLNLLQKQGYIDENGKTTNIILESFDQNVLKKINQTHPQLPLIQLLSTSQTKHLKKEQLEEWKSYAVGVGPSFDGLNKKLVQLLREQDLLVHAYTINNASEMEKALCWGVTGIFTDRPDLAVTIKGTGH